MKGRPTDLDTVNEFRAHYLLSGNASESARHVGIPDRTGREIAEKLCKDAEFAEQRRVLRAQYLDECVAARMRVMRKAVSRAMQEDEEFAGDDKRVEWADVVIKAEKNAHVLAKLDRETEGGPEKPMVVNVVVSGPDGERA